MNKFLLMLVLALTLMVPRSSSLSASSALNWQQGVRYEISAELDTSAKRLIGSMKLFYRNNSPDTLQQIFLQVPSNAFHDEENTAVREMRRFSSGNLDFGQEQGHKLTIESLQFLSIGDETSFPLQAYDFSDTILELHLPNRLLPGDTLTLGLHFNQDLQTAQSELPRRARRQRRNSDSEQRRVARRNALPQNFIHWFPRVAVYDRDGWHPEPFHFMMQPSDVYSEFADMDVTITVPGNYVVIASGEVVDGDPGWNLVVADTALAEARFAAWQDSLKKALRETARKSGPKRLRFRAKKVLDFVWSASPDLVHFRFTYGFPVYLFADGKDAGAWFKNINKRFDAALGIVKEHYGAYPFPHLTLVRSRCRNFAQPMLVYLDGDSYVELAGQFSEMYLPGMMGTNGVKESWLATGMQMYLAKAASEMVYGKRGYSLDEARAEMNWLERQYPLPGIDELLRNFTHLYNQSGQNEPIAKPIYEYRDPIGAAMNIYAKSDLFYEMLRYVVGDSVFKASWREIVRRQSFTHISEKDVQMVFENISGTKLEWFFEQWLRGTPTVDYSKKEVKKYRRDDKTWVTEVELQRRGDGIMPLDVELELDDGKKVAKRWDGKEQTGGI